MDQLSVWCSHQMLMRVQFHCDSPKLSEAVGSECCNQPREPSAIGLPWDGHNLQTTTQRKCSCGARAGPGKKAELKPRWPGPPTHLRGRGRLRGRDEDDGLGHGGGGGGGSRPPRRRRHDGGHGLGAERSGAQSASRPRRAPRCAVHRSGAGGRGKGRGAGPAQPGARRTAATVAGLAWPANAERGANAACLALGVPVDRVGRPRAAPSGATVRASC